MISNMLSNVLLTERGNRWITQLDDSTSMTSIAVRDGLDTSGRTLMEYKRSQHGGRERFIEEVIALIIWGFGIRFMKNSVYDPLAKKFTRIKHPDLDISMLKSGPQQLTSELVQKFNNHKSFKGAYTELLKVVNNEGGLQKLQSRSTNAKFLIATGIPALLIAFGTPTFNQWLTRRKLAKAEGQKQSTSPVDANRQFGQMPTAPFAAGAQSSNAFSAFQPAAAAGLSMNTAPNAFMNAAMNTATQPNFAQPTPAATPSPFGMLPPSAGPTAMRPQAGVFPGQPQFGGLGNLAATLLQNERYNTLLVDGVISGGRTYKARNWTERLEIIFRESLLILTLYFAQAPIQKLFSSMFDKRADMHTQLPFDTMKHLQNTYGQKTSQFRADYRQSLDRMLKMLDMSEGELFHDTKKLEYIQNFRWAKRLVNPEKVAQLEKLEAKMESKLVAAVHNYFLEGKSGDLLFETAKSCGWIPTFEKDGVKMLNLTQKVNMQPILRMSDAFGKVHEDLVKLMPKVHALDVETLFGKIMKKSTAGRFGAMVLANGACFFILSILGPKLQHKITKHFTGQDYFPGVRADQDQKSKLLNMA